MKAQTGLKEVEIEDTYRILTKPEIFCISKGETLVDTPCSILYWLAQAMNSGFSMIRLTSCKTEIWHLSGISGSDPSGAVLLCIDMVKDLYSYTNLVGE